MFFENIIYKTTILFFDWRLCKSDHFSDYLAENYFIVLRLFSLKKHDFRIQFSFNLFISIQNIVVTKRYNQINDYQRFE